MAAMRVERAGQIVELAEDEQLTFGRDRECTICLDPEDTGISRLAGSVGHENGSWWLTNRSSACKLTVVDGLGLPSVLAPGRRRAIEERTKILVHGTRGRHDLLLTPPPVQAEPTAGEPAPSGSLPTAIGEEVVVNESDRLAMVALFCGYLEEPPRYDPHPKDYNAAAARLGWPRTTLVKRIEYLRNRLDMAGVPNMKGFNALVNLAEYAISRGLITRDDLRLLRR
ncbi:hypothetical protein ETD86_16940 [Nonomuraea turkmeniaca]|uniref:FHA domain-containing protein n=1 Tax=Nonomuraea turkmeniaca TaxID=103838 RepID=A0A5S4G4Q3_9ACTN|nr:FHA domain-containing protein [Nonomuraea turkmeniaca]TMR20940.1 hypothetical protein ETD86_16940 [Nonomuraea turkmeniaca]